MSTDLSADTHVDRMLACCSRLQLCPFAGKTSGSRKDQRTTCRGDGFKSIVEPSNGLCPGTYLLGRDTKMIHRGSTTNLGCVQPAAHTCTCWLAVAADSARTTEGSKYRLGWAEYGVNGPAYPPPSLTPSPLTPPP